MALLQGYIGIIFLTFAFSCVDLALTTVLFAHGTDFRQHFILDVYAYNFSTSMFDTWVASLLRTTLLMGAVIGFIKNPRSAVKNLRKWGLLIRILALIMFDYSLVKMLAYTQDRTDLNDPWFWSLFAWSLLAPVISCIVWYYLSNTKIQHRPVLRQPCSVNADAEEQRAFLDDSGARDDDHRDDISSSESESDQEGEDNTEKKSETKGAKSKSTRELLFQLLSYSKYDLHYISVACVFLIIASVAQIFLPYYTGQVINGIAILKSKQIFLHSILIMAALDATSSIATGLRGGLFKFTIARVNLRIRRYLFNSLVQQEVGFFDTTKTGEITSRLTSDTTTMANALSLNLNIALRSFIQGVGTCVFMFKLSWRLSMVTVIGLPIIMVVAKVYGEFYKKLSKQVQDSMAEANNVAEEACSTMRTVRSFANEIAEMGRYADKLKITYGLKRKEALVYGGFTSCTQLFELSLVVATLYFGGILVISGDLSGGNLLSFILYQMELGFVIESLSDVYTGLMEAVGASEKVFEYIDREPEFQQDSGELAPETLKGKLEFRNVSFAYPSRPEEYVLKDVSFTVEPGEIVALVGPSGGGKSTCISLLQNFYRSLQGQVLLDSQPIYDYDHAYLHQKISLVGQEPVLYARSVKENIAYGLDEWDMTQVEQAAQLANAHQFIMDMKLKYDTETGEKGVQLSGGQKQRVAIARALIRNPTVLLLDEATSALDAESEHLVQQSIYRILEKRTVIIIAHRLSTVERANRIIVIDKGVIVEQGTHAQLLRENGMYTQLVQRQLLGSDDNQSPTDGPTSPKEIPGVSPGCSYKSIREHTDSDSDSLHSFSPHSLTRTNSHNI